MRNKAVTVARCDNHPDRWASYRVVTRPPVRILALCPECMKGRRDAPADPERNPGT